MADGTLTDVLAGGPLAVPETGLATSLPLASDPTRWGMTGPVGQAMGTWASSLAQGQAMGYARQIGQAQTAAMGDLGKYLAADDPVAAAAADSGGDPVARWRMMNVSPQEVATMRQALGAAQLNKANAELARLNVSAFSAPPGTPGQITAPASAKAPAAAGGPPKVPGASVATNVDLGKGTERDLLAEFNSTPPEQRSEFLQRLQPWQRTQLRQQASRGGVKAWNQPAPPTTTVAAPAKPAA